ncbi:PTS ascorbate transporter subunit IIC [Fusibacter ferrireducens]|uniref:Ascorbate-specific PTS system EIIC component n=1 Tax=Fusibacter ferrireducens TaxID=2785058 RepID=A0ABR9ZU51_9FIRM|nr:PTS ascorbate transporter subunit IIC [Fusibacter ferrireducens]MBF4693989.1 PTS ascorbate transporter subunit IIC [Fusibacter ferrireducens]
MKSILLYIAGFFSEAVFLIGFVALLGLLLQKKKFNEVLSGTVKTMIGFLLITNGAQSMGMTLLPIQPLIQKIMGLSISTIDIGGSIGSSMSVFGASATLIFAFGFLTNVLIARVTRFRYIHLSAHVSFFYAGLISALLTVGTDLSALWITVTGSLLLGIYLTFTCAYIAPLMKNIPGGEGFTIGHSSSIGCWISAQIGKIVGKNSKSIEEINLPESLSFLRETNIALSVIMTLIFFIASLFAGPSFVQENISGGKDIVIFSVLNGLMFGLWMTVIVTGVRMMLSEIVPAFHGISEKLVPNAVPGLDVPLLFPLHPTSVIVGFLSSLTAGIIGMLILGAIKYPVVVFPALIPTFFTGAVTAIFGNSTGGRRGAIIGSFVNGLILIFGQALLIPYIGGFEPVMRVLCETDYAFYGPLFGWIIGVF